jgi:hypothetical protein
MTPPTLAIIVVSVAGLISIITFIATILRAKKDNNKH